MCRPVLRHAMSSQAELDIGVLYDAEARFALAW